MLCVESSALRGKGRHGYRTVGYRKGMEDKERLRKEWCGLGGELQCWLFGERGRRSSNEDAVEM